MGGAGSEASRPARRAEGEVTVFTDGGCRGNPGPGAWAAVLRFKGRVTELSGVETRTTNNRMELTAAIRALASLKRPSRVRLVTDSEYLRRGMTEWMASWIARGWRTADKKPVLNRDLWERLLELTDLHQVTWEWVAGHGGHPDNDRCDRLVNEAMDRHFPGTR